MRKIVRISENEGRPVRMRFSRLRTRLWAEAVRRAVGCRCFQDLELVLGIDGRWEGIWSRYSRGLASPSERHIRRIEKKYPGTAKHFLARFWDLLQEREYTWEELDACFWSLPDELQALAPGGRNDSFGHVRQSNEDLQKFIVEIHIALESPDNYMHALTALLYALRQAYMKRDGVMVLWYYLVIAEVSSSLSQHLVLEPLSVWLMLHIVEPMRYMRFGDPEIDEIWFLHRTDYIDRTKSTAESFNLLKCLFELCLALHG
ncbi:hypothetical protein [Rugamonas aquatica]|uniref:Uncharacterized protein n=1 Tax=Rugamonas aquatica TaxID=2743357 RepID=A0A6A7N0N0_9BURK|nr:hypothetical protein [Rugamonas aquatica]MQA38511.1 hypothetical protein [Rugamonas aquatica]